ncbi:lactoylglutathione lyase family protein [Rheinheimera sp. A13L]|uniref:VOC family protein n=1 Tax=Rheinheimera sp. A13L TaxID=506534 RepID=UPI0002124D00|nr:VOC family protein [Rheinheimera sp. A13L]EGM79409.1 lactoylglutathione lyase family protein [Rheinheimera sp. A13L]
MSAINPVGWFEIPVLDMDRACAFYAAVLGAEFEMMEMGPSLMAMFSYDHAAPGCAGALVKDPDCQPSTTGTLVYFVADDVNQPLAKVVTAGGRLVMEKMPIGEHGFIGSFIDTEGNKVAVHSMK